MLETKLPPCLASILENKGYLERFYYLVIRYVHEWLPDMLPKVYEVLAQCNIKIDPSLGLFSKFSCFDVPDELCSEECTYKQDIFESLKMRTKEVKLVKTLDDEGYLLVTIDDKLLRVDLDPEKMTSSFVKEYASKFREYIDIDRRRKNDREKWSKLMNYWLKMAEEVSEIDLEESRKSDSDNLRIREYAINYLQTRMLMEKPISKHSDLWDTFLLQSDVALYDGEYAYFPRDELIKALQREGLRVSATKLSRCLKGFADVVRLRIKGRRISFYRYKPSEEQLKVFEESKKSIESVGEGKENEGG